MLTRVMIYLLLLTSLALVVAGLPPSVHAQTPGEKKLIEVPIKDAPANAKYALVIGITDYDSALQLHDCGNDANDFAEMLKKQYGFETVVVMTDDVPMNSQLRPSERNIKKALQTLYHGILPGKSEVVFFFSGHGTRAKDAAGADSDYLVPEDFDLTDIQGSCISYTEIRAKLDTLQPKRVLLITDACRDLFEGKGVSSTGYGQSLGGDSVGSEVAEFRSCLPTETSLEGDPADFSESVFTHYLIKGLSGDPDAIDADKSAITFDSLKEYVQESVHQYAAKLNQTQTPDGFATMGGMILARPDSVAMPVLGTPRKNPIDGAEMVYVPAGEFTMGTDASDISEANQQYFANAPKHTVNLDAYWIYKNDVSVAQYKIFCNATDHSMPPPPSWGWRDHDPIVGVSWYDAQAYASWAHVLLPTEAQWEEAARGVDGRAYPWGGGWDPSRCVHSESQLGDLGSTQPLGSCPSGISPCGALDMAGNVWQWCADYYDSDFYKSSPADNPTGPTSGQYRVLRGGSWIDSTPDDFRSAGRSMGNPLGKYYGNGFRCISPK